MDNKKTLLAVSSIITSALAMRQDDIEKFQQKVQKDPLHALEWNTSSVLVALHVTSMMTRVVQYLETDKIKTDEEKLEIVKEEIQHVKKLALDFLESGKFDATSSSASQNMSNIAKGKACGELLGLCEIALGRIEKSEV